MHYSPLDVHVLRALVRGASPAVGSEHRLRLEMRGLVVDGAHGLRLTPAGERAASMIPVINPTAFEEPAPARRVDSRGRRLASERSFRMP
jgi:hypothetical protein